MHTTLVKKTLLCRIIPKVAINVGLSLIGAADIKYCWNIKVDELCEYANDEDIKKLKLVKICRVLAIFSYYSWVFGPWVSTVSMDNIGLLGYAKWSGNVFTNTISSRKDHVISVNMLVKESNSGPFLMFDKSVARYFGIAKCNSIGFTENRKG